MAEAAEAAEGADHYGVQNGCLLTATALIFYFGTHAKSTEEVPAKSRNLV